MRHVAARPNMRVATLTTHWDTRRQIIRSSCLAEIWILHQVNMGRIMRSTLFFSPSRSPFLGKITPKTNPSRTVFFWTPVISLETSCWNTENLWAQWKVASCGVKQALICHRLNTSPSPEDDCRGIWSKRPAELRSGSSITVAVIATIQQWTHRTDTVILQYLNREI